MWRIKQIFDGDYGCEEPLPGEGPKVSVTIVNDAGDVRNMTVEDAWLTAQGLEEGAIWPSDRVILASQSPRRRELLQRITSAFEVIPALGEETSTATDPRDYVRELSFHKAREVMERVTAVDAPTAKYAQPQVADRREAAGPGQPVLQRLTDTAGAWWDTLYVIGSDTIVVCDGQIMGKPHDRGEAYAMIHRLQGRSHEVMTGVTILKRENACAGDVTAGGPILLQHKIAQTAETAMANNTGVCEHAAWSGEESYTCVTGVDVAPMTDAEIRRYLATGEADDKAGAYGIQGAFSLYVTGIRGSYSSVVGLPVAAVYQSLKRMGLQSLDDQTDPAANPAVRNGRS